MKRTKVMNYDRFRKVRKFHYKPLIATGMVSVMLLLSGCDGKGYSETPYNTVNDCYQRGSFSKEQCNRLQQESYRDAQNNGRRFKSREDCLRDDPQNNCQSYSSGGHFFYYSQPRYFSYSNETGHANALYRAPMNKGFTKSNGTPYIARSTSSRVTPATTKTTTRGGFGGSVARSFSSSSHSFGG